MKEFYGDGISRTVILTAGPDVITEALYFTDLAPAFSMHDMTWRGPGVNSIFGGTLHFDLFVESNLYDAVFERIEVTQNAYDGMYLNTPILSTFANCLFSFNANNGLVLNTAVACTLTSSYFITNGIAGVWLTGAAANAFVACAAESNGISYYMSNGCWSNTFTGCDAEDQVQRAPLPPTSFPAITVSAGGSIPVGTYHIKYSWIRLVNALSVPTESLPSPEGTFTTTAGHQTVSFTIPISPTFPAFTQYASVYITQAGGAPGTEVLVSPFPILLTNNGLSPTVITFTTPFGFQTQTPVITAMVGHAWACENSSQVALVGCSSNNVPSLQSRALIVTGTSSDVSTKAFRVLQEWTPAPTYDIEVDAPPVGQSPSNMLNFESDSFSSALVSIDPSATNVKLWLTDVLSLPHLTLGNSNVGVTTVFAGQTTREVDFPYAYTSAPVVLLTPLSDPGTRYWAATAAGSFTVTLLASQAGNVSFSYAVLGNPS
jgi:hypothetical protein